MANHHTEILNEQAAAWFVIMQRPEVSTEDRQAFDVWMEAPAHVVAYLRVEAAWERAERLKAMPAPLTMTTITNTRPLWSTPREAAKPVWLTNGVTRRAAASAIVVLGAGGIATLLLGRTRAYATALGEQKVLHLADGTRVNLNTASRIEVDYRGKARRVRLLAGEALFDVAKDPDRPFIVETANASVRALGTLFNVRLRDASVEVIVAEGTVAVDTGKGAVRKLQARHLTAGQAALVGSGAVAQLSLDRDSLQRRVVWTEGVIDLHGETLEQAVAEFNRYSTTKLVVGDPDLASLRVGGTFATHGADRFVAALEVGFGVRAVHGDDVTYLLPEQK